MQAQVTSGIVLGRINYGEADRIITLMTPDNGKIRVMARGVRKVKSKLAGGIELFSVSNITFIRGKKEISTLVSSRLQTHYSHIVEDINRTMVGYDILNKINKHTDDQCDEEYFELLLKALSSLNDKDISVQLTHGWFMAQLLKLLGHTPNTQSTAEGKKLDGDSSYQFDFTDMCFVPHTGGIFAARHIKLLRLLLAEEPAKLSVIHGLDEVLPALITLEETALKSTM